MQRVILHLARIQQPSTTVPEGFTLIFGSWTVRDPHLMASMLVRYFLFFSHLANFVHTRHVLTIVTSLQALFTYHDVQTEYMSIT